MLGVAWQITVTSFASQFFPAEISGSVGLAIEAPLAVLGGSGVVLFFLLSYVSIVAMRTFVAGETERFPREILQRRIPWVVANLVVGGIVYGLLTFIGTLLLVVPGVIAYVSLLFTSIYIAVEDENFLSAIVDSWYLTRGNWLRLFLLLLVIVVPVTVVFGALSVGFTIAFGANSAASQVISGLISMPFSILILGVLAEAFVQLRGDSRARRSDDTSGDPVTV
ncbi:hypothetical protein ACFQJD_07060 [Haloplanus sp. GCM10025708]|uniref:hypothetical protein n=1 Tax=Haloplanus sp. GCM10025708 TaxID=3252679 RepID=UPI00360B395A